MVKRMVAGMLVMVLLQVPSAWAEPPGQVSEPIEPMAMTLEQAEVASTAVEATALAQFVEQTMSGADIPIEVPIESEPEEECAEPAEPKEVMPLPVPETAKNPKPGIYSEEKLKKMIEEAKKKGQIVFIQISATWCGHCAQSIKDMQAMMDKYGKEGAIYIVVEVGATGEEMEAYKKKYPNTIFVIVPGESPPPDFPASSYPAIYYSSGTAWVPAPAGAPSEATLKKWQEAMQKWADEMKKAAGEVGN